MRVAHFLPRDRSVAGIGPISRRAPQPLLLQSRPLPRGWFPGRAKPRPDRGRAASPSLARTRSFREGQHHPSQLPQRRRLAHQPPTAHPVNMPARTTMNPSTNPSRVTVPVPVSRRTAPGQACPMRLGNVQDVLARDTKEPLEPTSAGSKDRDVWSGVSLRVQRPPQRPFHRRYTWRPHRSDCPDASSRGGAWP